MPRRRRIRFVGGTWDGYRIVGMPLSPELVVAVPIERSAWLGGADVPTSGLVFPKDVYRLERVVDHTGIPEKQYVLREVVR